MQCLLLLYNTVMCLHSRFSVTVHRVYSVSGNVDGNYEKAQLTVVQHGERMCTEEVAAETHIATSSRGQNRVLRASASRPREFATRTTVGNDPRVRANGVSRAQLPFGFPTLA